MKIMNIDSRIISKEIVVKVLKYYLPAIQKDIVIQAAKTFYVIKYKTMITLVRVTLKLKLG
jgi:hypothetical protein